MKTMRIDLVPIVPSTASVLSRLMQFYSYDFSEIMGTDIGDEGQFAQRDVNQYFADGRHPFLIQVDGRIAGFVIVDEKSLFGHEEAPLDVAEFFVLRKWRRQGVGRTVAETVFGRYHGIWEVRQVSKNVAATAFWREVIGRFMSGDFEETIYDEDRWRGPVQRFDSRKRSGGSHG